MSSTRVCGTLATVSAREIDRVTAFAMRFAVTVVADVSVVESLEC